MDSFAWKLEGRVGRARAGVYRTPHGDIPTPVFAPDGTQAAVKALTPAQLEEIGVGLILANTYHLNLRPGGRIISGFGGLHEFMQWPHPILTDSGGFQVFSLRAIREVDDDGVTFKSHLDGSLRRLTPEGSIAIQEELGADIIMALDEVPQPGDRALNEQALRRTHDWAARCRAAHRRADQALFGIVQGGVFRDLRERSAAEIAGLGFDGLAIGGLSVGESKKETYEVLGWMDSALPEDKPRFLMGVGTPRDLVEAVAKGVDFFDCVMPTRLARHHSALLRHGRMNILGAAYAEDPRPIEEGCDCYACRRFSRGYLRHLVLSREMLGATLLSMHNVRVLVRLAGEIRQAILAGTFDVMAAEFRKADEKAGLNFE